MKTTVKRLIPLNHSVTRPAPLRDSNQFSARHRPLKRKLNLDMVIGESSKIEADDKDKVDNLVNKVRELNGRLNDIRKEQIYQRV